MIERLLLPAHEPDFTKECAAHSADTSIVYKTVNGAPLYLGFYHTGALYARDTLRPLMIFVHGGGWQSKMIFPDQRHWMGDYLGYLARYYANKGCLCASIDYRLMQDLGQTAGTELIDLYEDCMDAAEYLRAHADEYGVDLKRVTLLGESAGGYLAAAMATLPLRDISFFRAVVLVNAITDLTDEHWQSRIARASAHPLLVDKSIEEKARLLSPLANIRAGLCPMLLLHGEIDKSVDPMHSQKFYDVAKSARVNVTLDWIENTCHAFLLVEYMQKKMKSAGAAGVTVSALDGWLAALSMIP